jgi:hypothetical protein
MVGSIMRFIEGYMNGNAWEELCVQCYRLRYQSAHYTAIPAVYKGDAGIEGYTFSGIVHQCYCPERQFSDDELYGHYRDKMTTDIEKLIDSKHAGSYADRLRRMGVPPIKEWHFNIPEYKDNRILEHAEAKRIEVLAAKAADPELFNHIHDNFKIIIKQAEDFTPEISRIIRTNLTDMRLNAAIQHSGKPDWSKCDSQKVENIRRKIKAVMQCDENTEDALNELINIYIEFYICGLENMTALRQDFPEIYEDLYKLEQSYKNEVKIKTLLHTDRSMNKALFEKILDEFQSKLEKDFLRVFTIASIGELKQDLIASWLADCSMEFRSV